jgi:hypothetical protein
MRVYDVISYKTELFETTGVRTLKQKHLKLVSYGGGEAGGRLKHCATRR